MVVPVVVFFTRFKVGFQHGRFHMASFEPDCFTRCTNPQLVAKREQILCMTSCEFNELAAKHKVGPLLFATTSWSHKLLGEELESFCIEYIVAAFKEIPFFCFSCFAAFRTSQHIILFFCSARRVNCLSPSWHPKKTAAQETIGLRQKGVYLIKNHRNRLLFGYYKLGFRCLELNLFSFPSPGEGGEGGDSHMEQTGMLVVNFVFIP